jgi:hypothetical protein
VVRVLVRCGIILVTHVTAIKQRTSESDFESTDEFQLECEAVTITLAFART